MKFTKVALTLLCCATLFCGCTKDSDVVLKINDTNITRIEFNKDFEKIKNLQLKNAPKEYKSNSSYTVLALKDRYINDVIARTLLTQEFEKRKITASEEEIKAKKADLINQIGSKEKFDLLLKQNSISEERLNSDLASEVKMDKLSSSLNKNKIKDSDAEKFYKLNKDKFTTPERVQVSHILFDTNLNGIKKEITELDKEGKLSKEEIEKQAQTRVEENKKLAAEVRQKAIQNPKNFAKLAKEYSQDEGSKKDGGDLGYITRDKVVKEFGDAAFSQKVGTISNLVESQYGVHIIYVKDKTAKTTQSYQTVKNDIKEYLNRLQKNAIVQNFIDGLKSKATIEYVDKTLSPEYIQSEIQKAFSKARAKK